MLHPSMFPRVHVCQLAPFSGDGRLYWAFDHLIAARPGAILLVPLYVVLGQIEGALHGCPAPWDEICDVLQAERSHAAPADVRGAGSAMVAALADLAPEMWLEDRILTGGAIAARYTHVSGITFAVAPDMAGLSTTQAVSGDVTAAGTDDMLLPLAKVSSGGAVFNDKEDGHGA